VVIGTAIPTAGQYPDALTEIAFAKIAELMPAYTEPSGRKLLRKQLTHLF
jgi:hypothetical protein